MCTDFEGKSSCAVATPPIAASARVRINIRIQVISCLLGRSSTLSRSGRRAKTRQRLSVYGQRWWSYLLRPRCARPAFGVKRTCRWLYEVTVAAVMTLGGYQICDRIAVECSIRYAERTMMRPRVRFDQRTSDLAWVDARPISCARSGRRNGARLRPLMIGIGRDIDR